MSCGEGLGWGCWGGQAGPGTIAESMIRGLPMIINDYIAGQVGEDGRSWGDARMV